MKGGKIIIIFSGYNSRAVISFIRTLKTNEIDYVLVARNTEDAIFKTIYKDKVIFIRKNQHLDVKLIEKCISIISDRFGASEYFIAPSTEALNRFLQNERKELEKMGIVIPLVDSNIYTSISDKKAFGDICKNNDINIPNEYDSINDILFPFVAKPRKYFARDGSIHTPYIILNQGEKLEFLAKWDPVDFYFQEYVEGKSVYLLYYFHRNSRVFKYSQLNIAQQPSGKSIVAAVSADYHNTIESIKYEQLFRKLHFYGLVMVEIKVADDKSYMIEANPRFWGPSQLFVDAGMDLFEALLYDYGFLDQLPNSGCRNETRYYWHGGVQETFSQKKSLCLHSECENVFFLELDIWLKSDVHKRLDTIELFREELKCLL